MLQPYVASTLFFADVQSRPDCNCSPDLHIWSSKMPHRAASPAFSDAELDITSSLFNKGRSASDGDTASSRLGLEIDSAAQASESDDEEFIAAQQAASNRKASNLRGRTVKKGGGFQAMGLNSTLLKAITKKGFAVPTPIQRKTIPLVLDGQDVVGMARTGSGKTAAFVIPMIEKLKAHSAKVGFRAIIMSPSRELALQTLKVVKEFGRGTDLRTILLVGGDSLEDQFNAMVSNPDIVIATPGRFLHLKVEMGLDLSTARYVVFDEADRLFEMGLAAQLAEIIHALPSSRQTLLFSATLPKSLVEFASAGLQEPKLIRLDAESKISPDLQSAFFTVKSGEKEGALLHVLQDIIQMPTGETNAAKEAKEQSRNKSLKRKRDADGPRANESPTAHSTIVFAATKHHVEYLTSLLRSCGFAVSHVYGSLDQTARKIQVQNFRSGLTNILVVTDVAARGIDIPILANVVNYDFPSQPKIFVHRVGRTARAGKTGWSYSLLTDSDVPYLLDLQLFLGKRLIVGRLAEKVSFAEDVTVGSLVRGKLDQALEVVTKLLDENEDLKNLREVAGKGEKLYRKTRNPASSESAKRAKQTLILKSAAEVNMLFEDKDDTTERAKEDLLARLSAFRPRETIFEIGQRGKGEEAGDIMRGVRKSMDEKRRRAKEREAQVTDGPDKGDKAKPAVVISGEDANEAGMESASGDEVEVVFPKAEEGNKGEGRRGWQDSEIFISYAPRSSNAAEERGYGVESGAYNSSRQQSNFLEKARGAVMELTNDDSKSFAEPSRARGLRWDKKSKKYVSRSNDEDGSKGKRMIKGESGQKIAAGFRSGRFEAWRKANKVEGLPRSGEREAAGRSGGFRIHKNYKHKAERAPREADKFRDDYHKQKKRVAEAKEKRVGKFKEGSGKSELRSAEAVGKNRRMEEKRREKNGRAPRKRRG